MAVLALKNEQIDENGSFFSSQNPPTSQVDFGRFAVRPQTQHFGPGLGHIYCGTPPKDFPGFHRNVMFDEISFQCPALGIGE